MQVNFNTEFGLVLARDVINKDVTVETLQKARFKLEIKYYGDFQFDAWKTDAVSTTLECRDQYGNLNPALA